MRRGHIPYGYKIENGAAVIDEEQVAKIKALYAAYLSGMGYVNAAEKAGLKITHAMAKRLLQNKHYLGDDFYPAIIDRETYDAAEKERIRRAEALGRIFEEQERKPPNLPTTFQLGKVEQYFSDPYAQAEYIYTLIGSEG